MEDQPHSGLFRNECGLKNDRRANHPGSWGLCKQENVNAGMPAWLSLLNVGLLWAQVVVSGSQDQAPPGASGSIRRLL